MSFREPLTVHSLSETLEKLIAMVGAGDFENRKILFSMN